MPKFGGLLWNVFYSQHRLNLIFQTNLNIWRRRIEVATRVHGNSDEKSNVTYKISAITKFYFVENWHNGIILV